MIEEQWVGKAELTTDQARAQLLESLADNDRELLGLRLEIERELEKHPDLCNDVVLFQVLQKKSYLADLMVRATPEVIQQLEDFPHTAEEAAYFIASAQEKYRDMPAVLEPRLRAYLQLFPDLANNEKMFRSIAAMPKLQHLMVFASDAVQTAIDNEATRK